MVVQTYCKVHESYPCFKAQASAESSLALSGLASSCSTLFLDPRINNRNKSSALLFQHQQNSIQIVIIESTCHSALQNMAQLSSLPNELLRDILGHVMPEDLENLAQTSKHIRSVSGPALQEHRRLIRKYSSFSGPAAAKTVEPLLKDVLANPRIGHYVKRIEICLATEADMQDQDEGVQRIEEDGEQEDATQYESVAERADKSKGRASFEYIHAAINDSKFPTFPDLRWTHEYVDQGGEEIFFDLLLPLLPNLTELSMADAAYLHSIYDMMKQALEVDAPFLSKLKHIRIQAHDYESSREHFLFDDVATFLPLPSLRSLTAVGAWQDGWRRELLEPPQISNVTHLELRECDIDSRLLDQFLRSFPHLQAFVHTSFHEDFTDYDFDPFIIRTALQARVSTTLRELTILTNAREHRKEFMGPLCGFKALEHVYSEWCCLIPDVRASVRGDDRGLLSLILPVSLKVLSVRYHDNDCISDHQELIHHAIQAKTGPNAPLPHLETLAFTRTPEDVVSSRKELRDGADQELQKRCDEVGLSLRFHTQDLI